MRLALTRVLIAFAIFKFFPHGGVARDLRKIAGRCLERRHDVRVYAMEWEGPPLDGATTTLLPAKGWRSHVRQRRFAAEVAAQARADPPHLLVGMNKMPGLDVYFAGDSCFEDKAREQRPWAYRLTPRYRHFAAFEAAVFDVAAPTRVLAISPSQTEIYRRIYGTPAHRFHAVPPGVERDRAAANGGCATALRRGLGVDEEYLALLFVGSGFVKKGLDRAIKGVAALPVELRGRVKLLVAGDDRPGRFERLARRLGIARQVSFLGGRDDVPALLRAADALVLPAYDENTGTAILEGMVAGLPVLATANCGYAHYLQQAGGGIVTPTPFRQETFDADLQRLLTSPERGEWSRRGRRLAETTDLHGMADCAARLLERFAAGEDAPLLALCVYRFAPADAHCRALLPIARACRERGMNVRIYAHSWHGEAPSDMELARVPVAAVAEEHRRRRYRSWVAAALRQVPPACALSFEPIDGVDLYYGPREDARTSCGLRSLPPGLGAAPARTSSPATVASTDVVAFAIAGGDLVGRGFERLLVGLGKLPEGLRSRVRMLAVGELPDGFLQAASVLDLRRQVDILPSHETFDSLIAVADVFVDLSYAPSSNGWIFDAMAAGRMVVTHDWLDEAALVREADAGVIVDAPFKQQALNQALVDVVGCAERRARWRANAAAFAADGTHYGQAAHIAALIDKRARHGDAASA